MTISVNDQHHLTLGDTIYWLRTPTPYDMPRMRRLLGRQGVRRPLPNELRVAALAGIAGMAAAVGDAAEGEAQQAIIEDWYRLSVPTDENDVEEPDGEKRAAEVERREADRKARMKAIYPDVAAIEANLERHHSPYAELVADGRYWDDVSRIDAVRLLLMRTEPVGRKITDPAPPPLPRDRDDLVEAAVYQSIPDAHRFDLATFAFALLAPTDAQRKN